MPSLKKNKYTFLLILSFILAPVALASTTDNVYGQAWSSYAGWISFNNCPNSTSTSCPAPNYGVKIDQNGNISGQAWSSNLGWLDFSGVSGCPSGTCQPMMNSSGQVSGWARFTAGVGRTDGWVGWLSLRGGNYGWQFSGNQGLATSSGQGWGSNVAGWVDFSGVTANFQQPTGSAVTVDLQANGQNSISNFSSGSTVNLTWTSQNAISCSTHSSSPANSAWNSANTSSTSSTAPIVSSPISSTTTFNITCVGANNAQGSDSVTVSVTTPTVVLLASPNPVPSNANNTTLSWSSPSGTTFTSCTASGGWSGSKTPPSTTSPNPSQSNVSVTCPSTTYTLTCSGPSAAPTQTTVTCAAPTAVVVLTATPNSFPPGGGTTTLSWNSSNVTGCTASATPTNTFTPAWAGSITHNVSGSSTRSVTGSTTFKLTCTQASGPAITVNAPVSVGNVQPPGCPALGTPPCPKLKPKFEEVMRKIKLAFENLFYKLAKASN